jgi:hypothetical protein
VGRCLHFLDLAYKYNLTKLKRLSVETLYPNRQTRRCSEYFPKFLDPKMPFFPLERSSLDNVYIVVFLNFFYHPTPRKNTFQEEVFLAGRFLYGSGSPGNKKRPAPAQILFFVLYIFRKNNYHYFIIERY